MIKSLRIQKGTIPDLFDRSFESKVDPERTSPTSRRSDSCSIFNLLFKSGGGLSLRRRPPLLLDEPENPVDDCRVRASTDQRQSFLPVNDN